MLYCQRCNAIVTQGSFQCPVCGLSDNPARCSNCGNPIDLRYSGCPCCGAAYSYHSDYQSQDSSRRIVQNHKQISEQPRTSSQSKAPVNSRGNRSSKHRDENSDYHYRRNRNSDAPETINSKMRIYLIIALLVLVVGIGLLIYAQSIETRTAILEVEAAYTGENYVQLQERAIQTQTNLIFVSLILFASGGLAFAYTIIKSKKKIARKSSQEKASVNYSDNRSGKHSPDGIYPPLQRTRYSNTQEELRHQNWFARNATWFLAAMRKDNFATLSTKEKVRFFIVLVTSSISLFLLITTVYVVSSNNSRYNDLYKVPTLDVDSISQTAKRDNSQQEVTAGQNSRQLFEESKNSDMGANFSLTLGEFISLYNNKVMSTFGSRDSAAAADLCLPAVNEWQNTGDMATVQGNYGGGYMFVASSDMIIYAYTEANSQKINAFMITVSSWNDSSLANRGFIVESVILSIVTGLEPDITWNLIFNGLDQLKIDNSKVPFYGNIALRPSDNSFITSAVSDEVKVTMNYIDILAD